MFNNMLLAASDSWLTEEKIATMIRVALLVLIGLPVIFFVAGVVGRTAKKRLSAQGAMLARKAVLYTAFIILIINVLYQLGFELTALLGAAGVVGIAIGFASQTSFSNIISGIFLIGEKPFGVGDVVKIGDTVGLVLSIDLMSVKMRTFDNQFVRIPNEKIISSQVINITRFPIRRYDINLGVAYKEDIGRVIEVLRDVADKNPLCLDEPEPMILFTKFGDSALEIFMGVWFLKDDFVKLRKVLLREIKERFDAEDIEIPFPHVTLYTGSVTDPFPVKFMEGAAPAAIKADSPS